MNAEAHIVFDLGSYAPTSRPALYGKFIAPQCGFDDSLAQLVCLCEVYDGFAGAQLMTNSTFLNALNKPMSDSEKKSSADMRWANNHFYTYNKSLVTKPSQQPPA